MWTTFVLQCRISLRRKSVLFWVVAFPVILATLFFFMFSSLGNAYTLDAQPIAVVHDDAWSKLPNADALVEALAEKADDPIISPTRVSDESEAIGILKDGKAIGYLYATDGGTLALALSDTASNANNDSAHLSISVLQNVLTRFNETASLTDAIAASDPQVFADGTFTGSIGKSDIFTREVTLTHFKPDQAARYHFALLGMACLTAMTLAIGAVAESQANLSALGARRTVAPLPKFGLLLAGFLSSWVTAFLCMSVAFMVIRYVYQVGVGGREALAFAGIAVATFMSSALGTALGAIPVLPLGSKIGISTALACILSLFSGLYGQPAMQLGDYIQRNAPILSDINPARQVSNLFYDILFYDSLRPFMRTVCILVVMSLIFLSVAIVLLRRQRYEYL